MFLPRRDSSKDRDRREGSKSVFQSSPWAAAWVLDTVIWGRGAKGLTPTCRRRARA